MSLNVILHPLVFLNISDHHTRAKVLSGKEKRVIGCLFGKQTGRNLEIFNSFELDYKGETGKGTITIEELFIKQQSEMLKQLFPEFEVIGWYSSSPKGVPEEEDENIHKVIQKYNENPIYLILNANPPPGREIPLNIYEGNTQIVQQKPVFSFQLVNYQIASLPAERVAVEGVAKSHEAEAGSSKYRLAMTQPLNAIKMLKLQLATLSKMIALEPKLKTDQDFLRKLNNILSRIPLITSPILAEEEKTEMAEVALVNEMATMAKTIEVLQEAVEKYKTMGIDK
jgi:COP9 signalosome complex subunit 6